MLQSSIKDHQIGYSRREYVIELLSMKSANYVIFVGIILQFT